MHYVDACPTWTIFVIIASMRSLIFMFSSTNDSKTFSHQTVWCIALEFTQLRRDCLVSFFNFSATISNYEHWWRHSSLKIKESLTFHQGNKLIHGCFRIEWNFAVHVIHYSWLWCTIKHLKQNALELAQLLTSIVNVCNLLSTSDNYALEASMSPSDVLNSFS